MERLVEVMLSKVNILSILDFYYRLFPLIYISYDSKGITIQGSCEEERVLATTVIPESLLNIMMPRICGFSCTLSSREIGWKVC